LTNVAADRYARHRAIEGFSQQALQASRFAVIGAGAIGNEVVKNLCLLGVGTIDVYDLDTVELHNLTRSVLLREADVGAGKAESVARRAADLDPAVSIQAIHGDVWETLGFEALRGYRCVIGALDNFEARLRVNLLCWLAGVDWINAAIDSRYVTVESFPFASDTVAAPPACYECGLPPSVYRRIAERYSCGGLQRAAARRRIVPTTTITASLAGAQAVNRALRPGPAAQRWLLDTHSGLATVAGLAPAPGCPGCGNHPRQARVANAPGGTARSIDQAAQDLGAESIRLSDALVWRCHCANCGSTDATRAVELQAAGRVPDSVTWCARCGSEAIRVEIRDDFDPGELSQRFTAHARVPARFAIAGNTCLDLQAPSSP
jgi:molybdopterin/thiamine biosynthesis adenylyltransferase